MGQKQSYCSNGQVIHAIQLKLPGVVLTFVLVGI